MDGIVKFISYFFVTNISISTLLWVIHNRRLLFMYLWPTKNDSRFVRGRGTMSFTFFREKFYISTYIDGGVYRLLDDATMYSEYGIEMNEYETIAARLNKDGLVKELAVFSPKLMNSLHDDFISISRDVLLVMLLGVIVCLFLL